MPEFDADFRDRFRQLLRWRRDVRHFKTDPLPDGLLEQLLADACLAPSVGLSEPWRFVIVEDATRRQAVIDDFRHANADALAEQAQTGRGSGYARLKLAGLVEAPVHLAVFAETDPEQGHGLGRRTMPETVLYSAAMSIFTLWLSARAHGVGLGWVSILDPDAVTALLDVPAGWRLVGYLCLGYPATQEGQPELEREGWEHRRPPEAHWQRR
jgi:5,6-dimethylbenzimidazole synthase